METVYEVTIPVVIRGDVLSDCHVQDVEIASSKEQIFKEVEKVFERENSIICEQLIDEDGDSRRPVRTLFYRDYDFDCQRTITL